MYFTENINRRKFVKTGAQAAAITTLTSIAPSVLKADSALPNIIFIISDQMRGDALSCLGSRNARTPNLDKMAAGGVVFENCFSNNPVCIPARKSIFSGLYPHQHGSLTNKQRKLLHFENTMAAYFQKRGYRIGWIGKNHTIQKSELNHFDTASIRAREPFRKYNRWVPPYWHGDTYWPREKCYPKKNTDESIDFIKQAKRGEPFFLHISYFDPHPPYFAPSEISSRYCSSNMVPPKYLPASVFGERLAIYARAMGYDKIKKSDLLATMRYYYAAIEWGVDYQVGRILDALSQKGLDKNMIIVFSADHGDFMGQHNMVRKGMFLHDTLLHVPMIWYAPGRIQKGKKEKALAQGIDIFPTLIDLLDGKKSDDLMGRSLKPFLTGKAPMKDEHVIFTSAGYNEIDFQQLEQDLTKDEDVPLHTRVLGQNMNPRYRTKMIRSREWKMILSESRPMQLFKMNDGYIERENVAENVEYASIRRKLEKQLQNWWAW